MKIKPIPQPEMEKRIKEVRVRLKKSEHAKLKKLALKYDMPMAHILISLFLQVK